MTKYELSLEWGKIIVPAISVFVSYLLGRISTKVSNKKALAKFQFDNFYLPFVQMYTRRMMWEIRFSELDIENINKFLNLIMENLQYLNYETQNQIPDFYTTYLELLEYKNGRKYKDSPALHIDRLFYDFTCSTWKKYIQLCKVLKLPKPSLPLLPNIDYLT